MKRIFTVFLAALLAFSCTACGENGFIAYLTGKSADAESVVPAAETETVVIGAEDGSTTEVEYLPTIRVGLQPESAGWPQMRLMDTSATVSYQGSIFQLTGLDDVGGYSYTVQSIDDRGDCCEIQMESVRGGMVDNRLDSASVMLRILEEGEENPWECFGIPYAPAGEIVHQKDENSDFHRDCLILEQTEDTLCFVADEGRIDRGVSVTFLICIRLYDGYFLEARAEHTLLNVATGYLSENDPYRDETLREPLRKVAEDLLRGAAVILQPTPEDAAKLLPHELQLWDGNKKFSKKPLMILPCSEILQLGYGDGQRSILRFRSVDADGKPVIITMTHIARMLFDEVETAQTKAWLDAYKANKKSPDAAMSEYFGVDAVPVDGGWVLDFGTTYAWDSYDHQQPLCVYLTMESEN